MNLKYQQIIEKEKEQKKVEIRRIKNQNDQSKSKK